MEVPLFDHFDGAAEHIEKLMPEFNFFTDNFMVVCERERKELSVSLAESHSDLLISKSCQFVYFTLLLIGLGCSIQYERNWLAHNEDFNSLLSSLNHNYGEAPGGNKSKDSVEQETIAEERVSLEHKSKTSGKRIQ